MTTAVTNRLCPNLVCFDAMIGLEDVVLDDIRHASAVSHTVPDNPGGQRAAQNDEPHETGSTVADAITPASPYGTSSRAAAAIRANTLPVANSAILPT